MLVQGAYWKKSAYSGRDAYSLLKQTFECVTLTTKDISFEGIVLSHDQTRSWTRPQSLCNAALLRRAVCLNAIGYGAYSGQCS